MALIRDSYEPFAGLFLRTVGLEGRGSLSTLLKTEEALTEKYVARRFPGMQQSPGRGESGNIYWFPGMGNLADALTKV